MLSHVTDQKQTKDATRHRLAMAVPPTGTRTIISDRYLDIPTQVRAFLYGQGQVFENHNISLQRLLVVGVLVASQVNTFVRRFKSVILLTVNASGRQSGRFSGQSGRL